MKNRALTLLLVLLPLYVFGQSGIHIPELPKPRPISRDTVTVRIIGDVMIHTGQIAYAQRDGGKDFSPFLDSLKADLSSATLSIANMEFSLGGSPWSGYPEFSAPDEYAGYVRDCGVDVFLTANNHILDRGLKGLKRTFSVYDTLANVVYTRANPTYVEACGLKIALINCTYGTNRGQAARPGDEFYVPLIRDREDILSSVRQAREEGADFIICLPHWGNEYELQHSGSQEHFAKALSRAGADVIVGAHPHCVQDFDIVGGVPVYYSIGNAVSNMSAANTQLGLMVTLTFAPDGVARYKMLPPTHEWIWCSRPGFLNSGYCTIKVRDFIGRRSEWINPYDYDKMVATYNSVSGYLK